MILFDRVSCTISQSAPRDRKMESKCARCETKLLRLARRRTIAADITRWVRRQTETEPVPPTISVADRKFLEIKSVAYDKKKRQDSRLVA